MSTKSIDELAKEYPDEWAKWNKTAPLPSANSKCPEPVQTPSDVANNIASTLQAAGVQACSTDQSDAQFSAQMQGSVAGIGGANMSMQGHTNHTATIGCEQVAAISNAYKQTVNNITCTIKNNTNNITNSQNAINAINIEAGGNISINCDSCSGPSCASSTGGGLSFDQSINLSLVSKIQLSDSDVTSIANNTSAVCQGIVKAAQESTNGLGATPQGSKIIQTATNTISQQNFNEAITSAINNINVTQNANNSVTIKAGGNITIVGKQCTFNQDAVLNIIAEAIVSNVIQSTMQNVATAINTNDNSAEQKATNKGVEVLTNVAAPEQTSNPLNGIGSMVVMIVVVIGVLGLGAAMLKARSSAMSDMSNMAGAIPPGMPLPPQARAAVMAANMMGFKKKK